jgi:hypothetical protein
MASDIVHATKTANASQQNYLRFESKDHKCSTWNDLDTAPTDDLCVAYEKDRDPKTVGPIILFVPQSYPATEGPQEDPNTTS